MVIFKRIMQVMVIIGAIGAIWLFIRVGLANAIGPLFWFGIIAAAILLMGTLVEWSEKQP